MPKIRDTTLPQINADQMLYGSIPMELMPQGLQENDMLLWDKAAANWKLVRIRGAVGLDVSYDAANAILEIALTNTRVYALFTADAYFVNTIASTFTANAVLV